jgi:hypothetical protein
MPTSNYSVSNARYLTDESLYATHYTYSSAGVHAYMELDLGDIYELDKVQVWHYYNDTRTYYGTKTEVSQDGINWYPLFDSEIDGTYQETS